MEKQGNNARRNAANNCADSMLNRITECFKDSLKGIPQIKSAVIDSINEDGSINIFFPPNKNKLFTRISNQSPFSLSPGDGVEIMLKNGSFDNCWIIAKHGITRADMNTQQNKISNDDSENKNQNIDSAQVVGVTKTSQLINDSKFISQDNPVINSPDLRGMPTAPTASKGANSSQIANTSFVFGAIQDILEESKVLTFEGTIGKNGTIKKLPDEHTVGDVYIIESSGLYAGYNCNIGDLIICIENGLEENNEDWYVIRTDLSNYIIGPSNSVNKHIAIFDGASGKKLKDSGFTIEKSVPSNAMFTDTHYTCKNIIGNGQNVVEDSSVALKNGEVYLNTVENNNVTSSHKIIGQGNITVTTDENGNIIISTIADTTT